MTQRAASAEARRRPVSAGRLVECRVVMSCRPEGLGGAAAGCGSVPRRIITPPQHGQRSWRARTAPAGCQARRAGLRSRRREQLAAERELGGPVAVGEEAVVADAMEAVRQGVQQEAADELVRRQAS